MKSSILKNNRLTLYFSPRKDKDLVNCLEGLEVGDINWFLKNLMRDGLKFRNGGNTDNVNITDTSSVSSYDSTSVEVEAIASAISMSELLNVDVIDVYVSESELEDSFDNL